MADIAINGNLRVGTLKKKFKDEFACSLRLYDGSKKAEDDATIASVAKEAIKKDSKVSVHGNHKIKNFEAQMKEVFGIRVQVALPDDSKLADNEHTLFQAGKA